MIYFFAIIVIATLSNDMGMDNKKLISEEYHIVLANGEKIDIFYYEGEGLVEQLEEESWEPSPSLSTKYHDFPTYLNQRGQVLHYVSKYKERAILFSSIQDFEEIRSNIMIIWNPKSETIGINLMLTDEEVIKEFLRSPYYHFKKINVQKLEYGCDVYRSRDGRILEIQEKGNYAVLFYNFDHYEYNLKIERMMDVPIGVLTVIENIEGEEDAAADDSSSSSY